MEGRHLDACQSEWRMKVFQWPMHLLKKKRIHLIRELYDFEDLKQTHSTLHLDKVSKHVFHSFIETKKVEKGSREEEETEEGN